MCIARQAASDTPVAERVVAEAILAQIVAPWQASISAVKIFGRSCCKRSWELAIGEGHRVVRAEHDAAAGVARHLERTIRKERMNIVRIHDIGLNPAEKIAKGADRLRIPKGEPGAETLRVASAQVVGGDAIANLLK